MKIPLKLKTKIYNECTPPVTTCSSEIWDLDKKQLNYTQRKKMVERTAFLLIQMFLRSNKINRLLQLNKVNKNLKMWGEFKPFYAYINSFKLLI